MHPYEIGFARKFGPEYFAYGFWKARVALYAILKALNLQPQDEVILPGYTCVVVANSVRYAGAKPIYADISKDTYNVSPQSVSRIITPKTRVLIAQHTYGIPADIDALKKLADNQSVWLVEDCAHVLVGSTYKGDMLGSLGHAAFFSFQWSKPYTTGLGGMAVTRDPRIAERLKQIQREFQRPPSSKKLQLQFQYRLFRQFFNPKLYWWSQRSLQRLSRLGLFVGSSNHGELTGGKPVDFTWAMSSFQQRVGMEQLKRIDGNSSHRQNLIARYRKTLCSLNWPHDEQLLHDGKQLLRVPLRVEGRAHLLDEAQKARIEIGSWFETPLHPLPLNQHKMIGYMLGSCPNAESVSREVINLPLHERVKVDEAEKIVRFIAGHTRPAGV